MGPILLAQLLGLNETQEGILNIAFKVADDQGLLLIDIKAVSYTHLDVYKRQSYNTGLF